MGLESKLKKLELVKETTTKKLDRLHLIRLAFGGSGCFFLILSQIIKGYHLELVGLFIFLPFFVFFKKSLSFKRFLSQIEELIWFYSNQLDFIRGTSPRFCYPEEMSDSQLARDLDLGVLQANLDYCSSKEAKEQLNQWLCQKFKNPDYRTRQSKIKQLAKLQSLLRKIQRKSKNHFIQFHKIKQEVNRSFLSHAPWKWLIPLSWFFSLLFLVTGVGGTFLKLSFFVYVSSLLYYLNRTCFLFSRLQDIHKDFSGLNSQMIFFENLAQRLPFTPHLAGKTASKDVKTLERLISMMSLRTNPIVFYILNLLAPLDFLLTELTERSRKKFLTHFENWSEEWILIECLGCFANLKIYHKTQWPRMISKEMTSKDKKSLSEQEKKPSPSEEQTNRKKTEQSENPAILAEDLRHPLINQDLVVGNDFYPKEGKRVFIITGSNMSGKSTFLRAMGLNYCLARIGAPVFAKSFYFEPVKILSCIRVSDSIRDGQSYFFAEVQRMKKILNSAIKEPLFFLIDEPLRGTNNRERLIGNQSYINQIIKTGARGFISTHDLELAQTSKSSKSLANYHFSEKWKNNQLLFDYKIKDGPSQTTNALKILEKEGLYRTSEPEK